MSLRIHVVTIFPRMVAGPLAEGIVRRAVDKGLVEIALHDLRDFTDDRHRSVDDAPFGGGAGMVMMAEPLALAVGAAKEAQAAAGLEAGRVIALSPAGRALTDARVRTLASEQKPLILVCGRYEGIDQRFFDACVDEELSIGDFVISGGELGAMVLMDAIIRQLPGAMKDASSADESFADGLLDAPQYTRPEVWRDRVVPAVLISGHHAQIEAWRREQKLARTRSRRPDLSAPVKA